MALSTGHVASQLRHLIYYQLDNNLIRNALFLAGRLHAFEPRSYEAQYLLALCHLHNGEVKAAFDCSQPSGSLGLHAGCAYVFAQTCLDLEKYLDGITALDRSKHLWATKNHWSKRSQTCAWDRTEVLMKLQTSTAKHSDNIFRMPQPCFAYRESFGTLIKI
jgi:anaphase-promoting complex subunit 3